MIATLPNSLGCIWKPPRENRAREPFTSMPAESTANSSPTIDR